jgi:hypothetical protein
MNNVQTEVLVSRVKSFSWRLAGFLVVAGLNWLSQDVVNWGLSPMWVGVVGLVIGEITKYLNDNVPWIQSQIQE